jgi:phosphoglycerate dehydrogenase-like enzyme
MTVVTVTQLEYDKARGVFEAAAREGLRCVAAPADEPGLARAIGASAARHAIVGVEPYTGALYEALPRGGVIARFGIGHDGIDKARATAKGLYATNTPGVLDDSVAEHAIALMLAAARQVPRVAGEVRRSVWSPRMGRELAGKTLAVIGCGPIGRRVAQIAAFGLGMRVIGCDIADVDVESLRRTCGFADVVRDFAAAVAEAAFVSLHIPSTPQTRRFLNAERLGCLRTDAWLINTARGAVVDEIALYDAVESGRLGGAALDVFEREPYTPAAAEKDLRTLEAVIMTPHVGSSTQEACDRMAERALANIRLAEAGRYEEMDLLNPAVRAR